MCSIDAAVKHECFVCSINNVKHSIILLLLCSVFNAADFVTGLHADRVGVKCRLFLCYSYSVWTEHWMVYNNIYIVHITIVWRTVHSALHVLCYGLKLKLAQSWTESSVLICISPTAAE